MKKSFSFRNTLVVNFLIVSLLPLIVIGFITLYFFTGYLEREITRKNFLLAKSLSGEIGRFLHGPKDMLRQVGTLIEGGNLQSEDLLRATLESVVSNYPVFDMIELLDKEGTVIVTAPFRKELIGLDLSSEPFFREVNRVRDFYWSSTFISLYNGQPSLTLALPLGNGILVGILNLGVINNFIDRLKSGPMEIGVVDRIGNFIAHSVRANVYQRVNTLNLKGIRKALDGIEGNYVVDRSGQDMFMSVAVVPETGWPVVVTQTEEQAFAPVYRVKNIFWMGIGLGVILALTLALLRVRKLMKPVSRLISDARRMAEGDYELPSSPATYSEIEELAKDFRAMAEAVAAREKTLRQSEKRFRDLFNSITDLVYTQDLDGRFLSLNRALGNLFGYEPAGLIGRRASEFMKPELRPLFHTEYLGRLKSEGFYEGITQYTGKDGRKIYIEYRSSLVESGDDGPYITGTGRDVTERVRAEREIGKLQKQMLQAKKMEAIGTLAGGIAHDFNNLLMGIQGNISLMLLNLDPRNPFHARLKAIEEQIFRGADLTKQLLGFARGGKYELRPIDLNGLIRDQCEMFGRTRKELTIEERLEKDLWVVEADRGQIEQVMLNLFVNASQAMPGGGRLLVESGNLVLDREEAKPLGVEPGRYVKVSVSDTGVGMDSGVMERIFDPFFTTREVGKGTGLGLASAYGIINNHGGVIDVRSIKGEGSTFTVYLPASQLELVEEEARPEEGVAAGSETILLVDDEEVIIEVGSEMLKALGYRVLTAGSGREAVEMVEKAHGSDPGDGPDLVILDMIMPEMGGGETFDALKRIDPGIRVILSSGYSIDGRASEILRRGCLGFIQKPFTIAELSRKLRDALSASGREDTEGKGQDENTGC